MHPRHDAPFSENGVVDFEMVLCEYEGVGVGSCGWKILIWQVDLIGKLIAGPPWFGGALGSTWVDRREEKVAHACAKFKTQTLNNPKPKHKNRVILDV